jgi:hypothetical protein
MSLCGARTGVVVVDALSAAIFMQRRSDSMALEGTRVRERATLGHRLARPDVSTGSERNATAFRWGRAGSRRCVRGG